MEILSTLFGGSAKIKIMRLFILNPGQSFDASDIRTRAKVAARDTRRTIAALEKAHLIHTRSFFKEINTGKNASKKRRVQGWSLNERFPYLAALQNLLVNVPPLAYREVIKKLTRSGKIRLIIAAGVFIQEPDSRVDLLIVGDELRMGVVDQAIRTIEADIGKELRYAAFDTSQFDYRLKVYDKLIRDVLDFPHKIVVDRMGITFRK
jgi:hypothetical protein